MPFHITYFNLEFGQAPGQIEISFGGGAGRAVRRPGEGAPGREGSEAPADFGRNLEITTAVLTSSYAKGLL